MSRSAERPPRWRHWLLVAEAAALLATARGLVAFVPFERWRSSLGDITAEPGRGRPEDRAAALPLRAAVRRALLRLPGEFKCLPQAMALQWMLRRRRVPSVLTILTLPKAGRGGLDSLHAWVAAGGEIVLGASDRPYVAVLHLATERQPPGNQSR